MTAPDADVLKELIRYCPETGKLFWLPRSPDKFAASQKMTKEQIARGWNGQNAENEALSYKGYQGYKRGTVLGYAVSAHRVAWAIYTGEWPKGVIDHINRDRSDNRIVNLRDCSVSDNSKNQHLARHNTSTETGVKFDKRRKRWVAEIVDKGLRIYLGSYVNFDTARDVRRRAALERGNRNGICV